MIASKIIFQSLTSVAVVGSFASGGYYMFNLGEDQYYLVSASDTSEAPTKDFFTDEPPKPSAVPGTPASSLFLNTVAGEGSEDSGLASAGVETGDAISTPTATDQESSSVEEKTTTQNYTCKSKDKKTEDSECKLFTIAFDGTNKSIDFSLISSFIKAQVEGATKNTDKITKTLNKSELTSKHFFILKASTIFITPKMVEGKKTITLASTDKDGADKDKSYATLTLIAQLKEDKVIGKTNLAVVQATTLDTVAANLTIPTDNTKTYTCTLQNTDKTELAGCAIQELTSYADSTPFNFSSITSPSTQSTLTILKDKYYLIKWTDNQKFSSLNNKIHFAINPTPPLTQVVSTTAPVFTELSPISRLIAHPTNTTPFSEVIIIN